MKLETILNAYELSLLRYARCDLSASILYASGSGGGLARDKANKYKRQAEKFKARLLKALNLFDEGAALCKFDVCPFMKDTNTADYKDMYEDDLYHYCGKCNSKMQIVRPGKWQCPQCG